jgi:hypothetical protein
MWDKVCQLLAGCRHRHISQPFSAVSTSRQRSGQSEWESMLQSGSGLYVVCLDCGKHFVYDWCQMRIMK